MVSNQRSRNVSAPSIIEGRPPRLPSKPRASAPPPSALASERLATPAPARYPIYARYVRNMPTTLAVHFVRIIVVLSLVLVYIDYIERRDLNMEFDPRYQ